MAKRANSSSQMQFSSSAAEQIRQLGIDPVAFSEQMNMAEDWETIAKANNVSVDKVKQAYEIASKNRT